MAAARGRGHGRRGGRDHGGMGFTKLQELVDKDGREVLNVVSNSQSGFSDTLNSTNLKPDWVKLIVKISAKACRFADRPLTGHMGLATAQQPSALLMTFLNLMRTSNFFTRHLLTFISSALTDPSVERRGRFPETSKDILVICKMTLQAMPNNIIHVIPVVSTLDMVLNMLRASGITIDAELENVIQEVKDLNEDAMKKGAADTCTKAPGTEDSEVSDSDRVQREPPTSFRELTVFPNAEDLRNYEKNLRKNKIHGRYENVEQYLDIHFRLLREDFMQPLRDGIEQYLANNMGPRDRKKLNNVRIYQGVYINNPVCMTDGISYRVQFDANRLKQVRWEATKRLIYGAMVCISPDSFKTAYFATVSHRDSADLKHGVVELQFQHGSEEVASLRLGQKLVMAESSAYFEAYRHVLSGIKATDETNLPFKRYFVECNTAIDPPNYLVAHRGPPMYDFRPLVDEKFNVEPAQDEPAFGEDLDIENPVDDVLDAYRSIPVLNRLKWPAEADLKLDKSQAEALRRALTSELAIIQGPPGTGKTYVGLKLVRMLLHNSQIWKTGNSSPILLICYTNHALDQFLEGICKFQRQGIVRVGGRSKSKMLERFYLRELRKGLRERKDIPADVHRARMDAMDGMDKAKASIQKYVADLEATKQGVVHEDILEEYIEFEHFCQLSNIGITGQRRPDSMFYQWLGLHDGTALRMYEQMQRDQKEPEQDVVNEVEGAEAQVGENPEIDDNDENEDGDVAVAENQRILQGADFGDIRDDAAKRKRIMDAALSRLAVRFADIDFLSNTHVKGTRAKEKLQQQDKEKIQALLADIPAKSEEDVGRMHNIHRLILEDRWKLYKFWLEKYLTQIHRELRDLENEYELAARRLTEVSKQEDCEVMKRATILGMTTTGAARYRDVLQEIKPKIVVVEEAAEVMEAHIVTALSAGCEHLILIGDHQQLRPNPTVFKLAETYKLKVSLFERMVINKLQYTTLQLQHRMRPIIAALLRHIYPKLINHGSVAGYDHIKGVSANLYFIDHDVEEVHNEDLQSKANRHEAKYMVALSKYLVLQGYQPSQITILTPYTGQVRQIRDGIRRNHLDDIRCCAIDNFQGEENDIILLSLVRNNPEGLIGFMKENNRICVSLSRAKQGMYIIGNADILAAASAMWSKMIESLREHNHIGQGLPLYCQNHENGLRINAQTAKDFDQAPEGGCLEPCEQRLRCGHVCIRMCHTYDRQHNDYKCRKECKKILCPQQHRCQKKCFEECGRCPVVVKQTVGSCGHVQEVPCYVPAWEFKCKAPCQHTLKCGHICQKACGDEHTTKCSKKVTKTLACRHRLEVRCSEKEDTYSCPRKCGVLLECEHPCTGTCGTCFEGRLHEPCSSPCGRTLVCGHPCSSACTPNCPACVAPCENRCAHSKCQDRCGAACVPCIEPCAWSCAHYQCTKLCYEPCNRPRCNKRCPQALDCGHRCVGLCGEPCPNKCGVCDKEEVQEIFFGDEEEIGSKFVQLEDCGHLLEVNGLDTWMDQAEDASSGNVHIALKACPKCKTSIRRNLRYGTLIKNLLKNIESVKKKLLDNAVQGGTLMQRLKRNLDTLGQADAESKRRIEAKLQERQHVVFTGEEAACVENLISFLIALAKLTEDLESHKEELVDDKSLRDNLRLFRQDQLKLRAWLRKDHDKLNDQQTKEARSELGRLQMFVRVLLYQFQINRKKIELPLVIESHLLRVWRDISRRKPLKDEENLRAILDEVKKHIPMTGLGISDEERLIIVKAMGLSQGHWYKCRNGHVYAIGDCGGATMEGTCPECKTKIGGTSHRLLRDNALASEMDGASRSAWPTGQMY